MKVAIQGQQGSYHHQAALGFFGAEISLVGCNTFKETFLALKNKKADFAVAAIENSLFGSINQTYDLLLQNDFAICGEAYLRIEHCLIGLPGTKLSDIKEVHSQLEALAQCDNYLDDNLPGAERIEQHDTAASVETIKKSNDPSKAAIASRQAALLHGLEVLQKNIEDNKENYTRFVVITSDKAKVTDANKASLVLTTGSDTRPGALHKALEVFAKLGINMTLLHSRPVIGKAWHYMFYVDIETSLETPPGNTVLLELTKLGYDVEVLGNYPAGKKEI